MTTQFEDVLNRLVLYVFEVTNHQMIHAAQVRVYTDQKESVEGIQRLTKALRACLDLVELARFETTSPCPAGTGKILDGLLTICGGVLDPGQKLTAEDWAQVFKVLQGAANIVEHGEQILGELKALPPCGVAEFRALAGVKDVQTVDRLAPADLLPRDPYDRYCAESAPSRA